MCKNLCLLKPFFVVNTWLHTGNVLRLQILQGCRMTGKYESIIVMKFWGIFTRSFDFSSNFSTDIFYFMGKTKSLDIAYSTFKINPLTRVPV